MLFGAQEPHVHISLDPPQTPGRRRWGESYSLNTKYSVYEVPTSQMTQREQHLRLVAWNRIRKKESKRYRKRYWMRHSQYIFVGPPYQSHTLKFCTLKMKQTKIQNFGTVMHATLVLGRVDISSTTWDDKWQSLKYYIVVFGRLNERHRKSCWGDHTIDAPYGNMGELCVHICALTGVRMRLCVSEHT